jgi:hypothetical protein
LNSSLFFYQKKATYATKADKVNAMAMAATLCWSNFVMMIDLQKC